MTTASDADWLSANQVYLAREMARLKSALKGEAAKKSPSWAKSRAERPPALEAIAAAFELSPFERELLLFCAAFELDPEMPVLCGAAEGGPGQAAVSFSLALAVLPDGHWSALGPQAPLRRWRLIEIAEHHPLTVAPLRIDETVLHALTGIEALDPVLDATLSPLRAGSMDDLASPRVALAGELGGLWGSADEERPRLAQLIGEAAECRPIVAAAAAALGIKAWVLSGDSAPNDLDGLDRWVRLWRRQARLSGRAALLIEPSDAGPAPLTRLIDRLAGPLALADPDRAFPRRATAETLEVRPLPASEQRQAWIHALRRASPDKNASRAKAIEAAADMVAAQFSLGQAAIETLAADAVAGVGKGTERNADLAAQVWRLARSQTRSRLDGLAKRMESSFAWDDLVLPEAETATLRAIAAQLRQRMTVYERWGFAEKSSRGLGISALFAGPSGAGKTMAAEVLARDLQLDLYRIDLSSVISKDIGETEKNLRRVFEGAEQSGAVLLFDEADALFGKRSEVKDSLDRYANIEVSYLLQQMEAYRGLAILTTNLKTALDPAFLRRLRFVVQFPFPGPAERLRLWEKVFPAATPTEGLDLARLAQLKVTGGNIRSIAMNAAFLAAEGRQPVRMTHLKEAARIEYAKLERHQTTGESEAWV
ncbi:MAG TPA: ATP-binding protein [Caulobacteraceae bacterium]|nr:ATP-binding protein [Caulobacteraceae bacterium]